MMSPAMAPIISAWPIPESAPQEIADLKVPPQEIADLKVGTTPYQPPKYPLRALTVADGAFTRTSSRRHSRVFAASMASTY
jgi:hypothetical protein